jgi:pilus assembly protein CpaC
MDTLMNPANLKLLMQERKSRKVSSSLGMTMLVGLSRVFLAAAGAALFTLTAAAQLQPAAAPASLAVATPARAVETPAQQAQNAPQEGQAPQTLHILVGHSLLITSPTRIKRISLADPAIAEATVVSPYQVLINGKTAGGVSLIIWDEAGQNQNFEVSVDIDILGLTQKIHEVFPGEPVQIETSGNVVMLSGSVSSAEVADKIQEVVKNVTPKVTSLMQVPPPAPAAQISLQVRFAEVNKTAMSQLGVNILHGFTSSMPFATSTQQFSPPTLGQTQTVTTNGSTTTTTTGGNQFTVSNLLNVALFRPDIDLAAFIQALEQDNLIEILAEPNLLTESGKEGSFLAGGQFPYPVPQSTGANGLTTITIQFKEFGVRLNFTPTVLPDGTIHLKLSPEVSALDFTNALRLNGFLVPALAVNQATSEIDLKDGQSFVIAGLLDDRVINEFNKIPGIGDIPILGKLFQSRDLNRSKNELIILATPRIVHPLAVGEHLPELNFPRSFLPATPGAAPESSQPNAK